MKNILPNSTITPDPLLLSESPNTHIPQGLHVREIALTLRPVSRGRCGSLLGLYGSGRKQFVNPRDLLLEFAFVGFVFGVNGGFFPTETSYAQCRGGDLGDVDDAEMGAGDGLDGIAFLDDLELLQVFALGVDVLDPSAHLRW